MGHDDYAKAQKATDFEVYGEGAKLREAVGDLIVNHSEKFGIKVVNR